MISALPLLIVKSSAVAPCGGLVIGQRDLTRFYIYQVLYKDLVVPSYFLGRFPTHGFGHILPAVWSVLVIQSQSLLELLILLWRPRGSRTTRRTEKA